MSYIIRLRLKHLLLFIMCLLILTPSMLAQDTVTETPAEVPAETTEIVTEVFTRLPTELPTEIVTEIFTEVSTAITPDTPTETPAPETTEELPTATAIAPAPDPTEIDTIPPVSLPEPPLTLLVRELFEVAPFAGWTLPPGWTQTTSSDGGALNINALEAGFHSAATLAGSYENVAVKGYFTFVDTVGSAQLIIRDSAMGAYLAQLDADGLVTLARRDGAGVVSVLGSATAPAQTASDAARIMRFSAMDDGLRVTVDDIEVLAVIDSAPLPSGTIKIGITFADAGAVLFDNFFLWIPTSDLSLYPPTTTPPVQPEQSPQLITIPPAELIPTIPSPVAVNGKSTILAPIALDGGPLASPNDDFANRQLVNVPSSFSGNTTDNSVEPPNEPSPSCGFNISGTVWYEFTPPAGGLASEQFLLTSIGSNFDTMIAVYTGTWGSLTQVACADDVGASTQAQLTTTLTDGVTYYIQLGGYNGSAGNFFFALIRPVDASIPTAPVVNNLAGVAHTGKTNLLQPTLAWNTSGVVVPFNFEVQVSTVSNFATLVATDLIPEPTHTYQITPALSEPSLAAGQVYYWRVRARNILLQSSAWSATYIFTLDRSAPTPPNLTAPTLNGVVANLRPTFTWHSLPDVNRYHLRIATNFSCTTLVGGAFDLEVITASHTVQADLPQGEYWFCVEAKDIAGNWSGFGEKRRFIVNLSLAPANNALVVAPVGATTADLTFKWLAVAGATYHLEVADDSSFAGSVFNSDVVGTTYTLSGRPFGNYYWRVRVNGANLPASLAYKVTLTPPLPTAPAIQSGGVANAGFTNDTTPLLDWTIPANWVTPPLGQSITYELQLSTNSTFTALVASPITGIFTDNYEWTATTLADTASTIYYWRVRARTNLGLYGAWSPTFRFTLDTEAPNPPPSLTTPLDNFVSTTARPLFSWQAAPGANRYRLEISTDNSDYDPPALPDVIATIPRFTHTISLPQGTYYWRVWSLDAAGNESLTSASERILTIDYRTAPPLNYTLVPPGIASTAAIRFTWMPAAGAIAGTNYTIEIDTAPFDGNADITSPALTVATWTSLALAQGEYQYRLVSNNYGTSDWRKFVISPALPGMPGTPFAPANNAFTADTTPQIEWNTPTLNAGNVAGYRVEISTTNTFTAQIAGSPFDAGNALNFTPPTLADGRYYWRVRAYTILGAYGPYAAVRYFTVDTLEPDAPLALIAPADNFVSSLARPAFSWQTAPGANRYRFEISTDNSDYDPPALPDVIITTTSYLPTASLPQGTYFWRVWSLDAAGNESLSSAPERTLTLDYRLAPVVNYTTLTATTSNIPFTWRLVTGAPVGTTYTIEIDAEPFTGTADITLPAVTTAATTASGLAQGRYQYRLLVNNGFGTSDWRTFVVSPLLPGAPVAPFTPANLSFTADTTPTLQWNAPTLNGGNVTGYLVEISTTSNFTAPIAGSPFDAGVPTAFTTPALAEGRYYWRVRAKAAYDLLGGYTPAMAFTVDISPPLVGPNLIAPVDNLTTNLPRPVFSWGVVATANRYVIEIDDENGFNIPLFYTATVTTTSHTLPTSTYLRQGTYYWRVWAMDAAGNLNPVAITPRTLHVNYAKTPLDNTVFISAGAKNVTVTWTAVPITPVTASTLRIQIDNNSDFSSPEHISSLMASNSVTYTTTAALPHGTYYWRLLVNGHPVWPTVLARRFTISPVAPPAPVLSALPAAINDTTPSFNWTAVSSPAGATVTGYELQLSITNNFATLVGGAAVSIGGSGTTSYEWTPELAATPGQMYYARIRAVNNLGVYGNWSVVRGFRLDTSAPSVPSLIAPAYNAIVTTQTPTFTWGAVAGATRYEIRYGTTPNLNGVIGTSVTTTSYRPTTPLLFTNYYWEVRALDAAGNALDWDDAGTWETITNRRMVKITAVPGGAPTLWGYDQAQPNLTWTPLFWADAYHIQVSSNNTFTAIVWEKSDVAASSTPNTTVGVALASGMYYWRVRASTPALVHGDVWGSWSSSNSFNVEVP